MNCETALELLSASLDGELTAAEQQELQAHLDQCPSCRAIQTELVGLHTACGEMEALPPAGLKEQIMKSLPPQRPGKVIYWKRWGAMAAALALVALAAWRLPHSLYDRPVAEPQNDESAVVTADDTADLSPEAMVVTGGATNGSEDSLELFNDYGAAEDATEEGVLFDSATSDEPAAVKAQAKTKSATASDTAAGRGGEPVTEYSVAVTPMVRMASQSADGGETVYAVDPGDTDAVAEVVPNPDEAPVAAQPFEPIEEDERDFSRYCAVITLPADATTEYDLPRQLQENGDMWYLVPRSVLESAPQALEDEPGCALRLEGDDLTPDAPYVLVVVPAARQ